jgi:hypothetical protein
MAMKECPRPIKPKTQSAWLAVLVTGLVTALSGCIGPLSGGGEALPKASTKVGLLNRPAEADDMLPAGFSQLRIATLISDSASARLARSANGIRYFIAPGKASSVCLLWTSGEGSRIVGSGTCGALSDIDTKGIYLASGGTPNNLDVALLAPDGYDRADGFGREVSVTNNLALFADAGPGVVVLRGPHIADQRLDLRSVGGPGPTASANSN